MSRRRLGRGRKSAGKLLAGGCVCAAGILAVGVCATQRPVGAAAMVTIILTGNARGVVEPCGCQGAESGGLAERTARVRRLKRQRPEALLLDVGNQTDSKESVSIITRLLALASYDAVAMVHQDLKIGAAFVDAAKQRALPLVCGLPATAPHKWNTVAAARIVSRGGMRIAVTSVAAAPVTNKIGRTATANEDRLPDASARLVSGLHRKAELVIVLSDLGYERDRKVFPDRRDAARPEIVVSRGARQAEQHAGLWFVQAPRAADEIVVATGVGARGSAGIHVTFLRVRSADPADAKAKQAVERYFAARQQAVLLAAAVAPADWEKKTYAPAQQCNECHPPQCDAWARTRHAAAAKLLRTKRRLTPECLPCHSEMYRRNGRLSAADPAVWNGVECASCHGDGIIHAEIGTADTIQRKAPPTVCRQCHTAERDPGFRYAKKLKLIEH